MPNKYKHLLIETSEEIATVTINRPEALNALSVAVINELRHFVDGVPHHHEIRAIILTGAGEKAFVAGADISELNKLDHETGEEYSQNGNKVFRALELLHVPVIAAVNGFALGGGCELAMACHFRIASTKAKFGQPEVNLGLIPGFGGTQRLCRLVGTSRALQLILTGETIDAAEAYRIGLVNKVVEPDQVIATARELAKLILSKGPVAVRNAIRAVSAGQDVILDVALSREAFWFGTSCSSEDMREGTSAFLEKRKPVWKNR
jgi:enoyl-CoA hydratase